MIEADRRLARGLLLAIEPSLQLLDRGAGQHPGLGPKDVVNVRADRREKIDLLEVRGRLSEPS
jgi:hypothetical protein